MTRVSIAPKPSTFMYDGKEVSGTPNESWPLEKSIAWLRTKDFPPSSKVYLNVAKLHNTTVDNLVQQVQAARPKGLPETLEPLTPNLAYGPLSVQQKQEIWDHHSDVRNSHLAYLYGTNVQNVRLAKQQRFTARPPGRQPGKETLKLDPFTPSMCYGPLTQAQQLEIFEHHGHIKTLTALANTYKTSVHHIRKAQRGLFNVQEDTTHAILSAAARLIGVDVDVLVRMMEANR